jgi:putative ABC transport system permease protein
MALREARAAWRQVVFAVGAIAVGVGALMGILGFSRSMSQSLHREARVLMAADLKVSLTQPPTDDDWKQVQKLENRGLAIRTMVETLSMASAGPSSSPLLVSVKAVDPDTYPWYGRLEIQPRRPLSELLRPDSLLVSSDLLIRLGVSIGDRIRLGSADFRIAGLVQREPDRLTSFGLGPRLLLSHQGLERAGLIRFGSRATHSFLFRAPPGAQISQIRAELQRIFGARGRVTDYTEANPQVAQALRRTTTFLGLVSLISLAVGGLGVAGSIHTHLQQKLDIIAILKCLGARSGQILRLYLSQALLIGWFGSLVGLLLGYLVQALFPLLLAGLIEVPTRVVLAPDIALSGMGLGLLTALAFSLPPLMAVRRVRPALVFRRHMVEQQPPRLERLRRGLPGALAGVVPLLALGAIATFLSRSAKLGFGFIVVLLAAILILGLVARLLLLGLRRLPRVRWPALRHGLANLRRPGSQSAAVIVSLGIGVTLVLTTYLLQRSLLDQVRRSSPQGAPNVFLINITEAERPRLWELLRQQRGVLKLLDPIPAVSARLLEVDGRPVSKPRRATSSPRFYSTTFVLTWTAHQPRGTEILSGHWWDEQQPKPGLVSVGEWAAENLKARPGMRITFDVQGISVAGVIANLRRTENLGPGTNNQFIFSPGSLDNLPTSYYGALRLERGRVGALQEAVFERFPAVTVVDGVEVLGAIQGILDRVGSVVRWVAGFAILAGVILLASSVAATRVARIREIVMLKALGATRAQVRRIQAAEFALIGTVAGLAAAVLASLLASFLMGEWLEISYHLELVPLIATVGLTVVLAIATGWLSIRRMLRCRPLEILRDE